MAGEPSLAAILSYVMARAKSQSGSPVADRRRLFLPPLVLDRASATPLYTQISAQFAEAVSRGADAGARLPSTRLLARMLGVSRNTIVTAYEELVAAGVIEGRVGSAMVIAPKRRGPMGGFEPQRVLREAQYPSRTLAFEDPDGSPLYLTYQAPAPRRRSPCVHRQGARDPASAWPSRRGARSDRQIALRASVSPQFSD
jgi:DNA-binding transcriptional regulator YhcF (GntR family)